MWLVYKEYKFRLIDNETIMINVAKFKSTYDHAYSTWFYLNMNVWIPNKEVQLPDIFWFIIQYIGRMQMQA